MTAGFGSRLQYLGITVKELTGDMQLTKQEIEETQIIVTTPEKWDVITRKSTDSPLTLLVKLLILDEVHLLNEDRGPVIETLVARTLRQVEATQSMIRIVGLSATLPNYKDVAQFMRVNEGSGLHYFDASFRPVPLEQTFVGVKGKGVQKQREIMTRYCYEAVLKTLRISKQSMVFVHSRKDTLKTALDIIALAEEAGTLNLFSDDVSKGKEADWAKREMGKSRNADLKRLLPLGFACHHAGMLRSDRNLVEKMFHMGLVKVLCCTATLAWGVNLPCKQVIIKGTQVYNAEKGAFGPLGMLDVMQIFGRAGRPQFDDEGSAIMITTIDELYRYLALTSHQAPIESQFVNGLADNLNAEIVLGTVTNIQEAVTWLSYTYLFVRMLRNPMVYGISYEEIHMDANLVQKRTELIVAAAQELDDVRMIRFNNPYFSSTNMGQTASHYYIHHETIRTFNEAFEKKGNALGQADVLKLICNATEFENITTREEELAELDKLKKGCAIEVGGDAAGDKTVKVNILLQSYISRAPVTAFALVCDTNYIAQNGGRIARGLFEIALRKGLPDAASLLLKLCKEIDLRLWSTLHPLRQFPQLSDALVYKLEQRELSVERLLEMEASEISAITRVPAATAGILSCLEQIPYLEVESSVQPITRTIIRIKVTLTANFRWNDKVHGQVQPFWLWVESPGEGVLHHEYVLLRKKENRQPTEITFTVPISHPVPPQYVLHVCSDRWLGSDNSVALSFKHLILPQLYPPHTTLLDLQPLPVAALQNTDYQKLFPYAYFNPIQTQIFHTLYHSDQNVLLGAPTGSGKTVAAELAVLRLMRETPHLKVCVLFFCVCHAWLLCLDTRTDKELLLVD
jgi:activating signal cointegrator complex subunit 3